MAQKARSVNWFRVGSADRQIRRRCPSGREEEGESGFRGAVCGTDAELAFRARAP
jgi:hypothetical protein